MEEFITKCEEIKVAMLRENPTYDDGFFMQGFIGGLKEELKAMVVSQMPKTLRETNLVAAHQELVLEMLQRGTKHPVKNNTTAQIPTQNQTFHKGSRQSLNSTSNLRSPNVSMNQKRSNVCYKCKETWVPGHTCKAQKQHQL